MIEPPLLIKISNSLLKEARLTEKRKRLAQRRMDFFAQDVLTSRSQQDVAEGWEVH